MKRIILIGSLAAAVALLPDAAVAQDTVRAPGTLARTPSFNSLIQAIDSTATATARVTARAVSMTDVRIIDAKTVIGSDNAEALDKALDLHKEHLQALQAALAANTIYTAALAAHADKPEPKDVIAVDILDTGDVLVYFRK